MGFLEIARADLGRRNVSRDRHYWHARAVAVEQTIDQVQVAWAATSGADREAACDMRIRAGRERGDFLVPDMQPLHAAVAPQRIGEAIEAVAHDSIDTLDTGGGEGFDHLVCDCLCHDILLKIRWMFWRIHSVRRRCSLRTGRLVHVGREAGVDLFGIERCDGFGSGKGYRRAVLVTDPRYAVGRRLRSVNDVDQVMPDSGEALAERAT